MKIQIKFMEKVFKLIARLVDFGFLPNRFSIFCGSRYNINNKLFVSNFLGINMFHAYLKESPVFLKFRGERTYEWYFKNLYFYHYVPKRNDVYVVLGAGNGFELIYAQEKYGCRVAAFEPNSLHCYAFGLNLKKSQSIVYNSILTSESIDFQYDICYKYLDQSFSSAVSSNTSVPISDFFNDLNTKFGGKEIDLLQVNIEGAELDLIYDLAHLGYLNFVKRINISCHDFLPQYRDKLIKNNISDILEQNGYTIVKNDFGIDYLDSWIYCEKRN
jgi:hypothetical protein